ncbi:MAG: response regulator, partial [Proteobacteria bacterium]|nr:response regulator [Pseudomonadota bacterium]
ILLLTSAGTPGDAGRCRSAGVAGYLLKPVRRAELEEALRRCLAGRASALVTRHTVAEVRRHREEPAAHDLTRRRRLLLAEDNPVNRRLVEALLAKEGWSVRSVGTGREAVDAWREESFDRILMDVQMPDLDGFAATREIRAAESRGSLPRTPIVALTAHALAGDRERCLAAGMDGYLAKPLRREELRAALAGEEPASGSGRTSRAVDLTTLRRNVNGDEALIAELAARFLGDWPVRFAALREAAAGGAVERLAREAHALKGAVSIFGAPRAEGLAQELETWSSTASSQGDLQNTVAALEAELAAVHRDLETELSSCRAARSAT